jgi:ribonucleoside-diphosphate reductase alpha chain
VEKFDVFSNSFSQSIFNQKYSLNGQETWADTSRRVVDAVCGQLLSPDDKEAVYKMIVDRKFIPGGRYLYSAGRPFHQVNNCFLFRAEDSREGWSDLMYKITSALMTGGGIGVDYSALREEGALVKRTGGLSTGPIALMKMVNEAGRNIMQGGQRRSAIYASLNWKHKDIFKFLAIKNHSLELKALKEKDFNFPLDMELTNISVNYDTEFFIAIEDENHALHSHAKEIYMKNCRQAFETAEPGFSFNFRKDNETLCAMLVAKL